MQIWLHRNFERRYAKLPLAIKEQFKIRRNIFLKNPFHPQLHNHPLRGIWENYRSINIAGDWRVMYHHLGDEIVEFVAIGTHSELYE